MEVNSFHRPTYAHLVSQHFKYTDFPSGMHVDRTVSASDVRAFSSLQSDRSDITCFRCGENGHRKNECMQWKTRLCWHFMHARCWKENCPFAHGQDELRAPWHLKCIRIIKVGNAFHDIGCGSLTHSFRNCPNAESAQPRVSTTGDARSVDANNDDSEDTRFCVPCAPPPDTVAANTESFESQEAL